jgi:glutathione synthase
MSSGRISSAQLQRSKRRSSLAILILLITSSSSSAIKYSWALAALRPLGRSISLPRGGVSTTTRRAASSTNLEPFAATMETATNSDDVASSLPLEALIAQVTAYASAHGIQVATKEGDSFECAPVSLLPNHYPAAAFEQAVQLSPLFNQLVDGVSRNGPFLQRVLSEVTATDSYTAKLLQLYQDIYQAPITTHDNDTTNWARDVADHLGILRSDYMLTTTNDDMPVIKQIEINTIASSFASLSTRVSAMHQHVTRRFGNQLQPFFQGNAQAVLPQKSAQATPASGVPDNAALSRLAAAMKVSFQRYQERFRPKNDPGQPPLVILFVVQEGERNSVDQRLLEFELFDTHGIPVVRRSLTALSGAVQTVVDPATGALCIQEETSSYEVALVYFRAGYAPTDYPNDAETGPGQGREWLVRAVLEQSRATKCPSLGYHLAGTKKVQQELARPGVLEQFLNKEDAMALQAVFAGLYSLGNDAVPSDLAAVAEILFTETGPARYVLKPQREGGGYNFYNDELRRKLQQHVTGDHESNLVLGKELGEYILMERLFPPPQTGILLRSGRLEGIGLTISELGCYGTVVATANGTIVHNEYAGYLLRTKFQNVNEGGVASGFSTLSSPYLC